MASQKSLQAIEAEGEKKCPDCGSEDLVKEAGELYCKKCGFVIDG
jgi:DNA-directed RNA polymerase subunit RPC12/RpoP